MAKLIFRKESDNYIGVLCIMLLFLMFTTLSLALVLVGADSYKGIKRQTDVTFNSGALMSYIENKVHNYDNQLIDVEKHDGLDTLVLREKNSTYMTYIYCFKGHLYENLVDEGTKFVPGDGEELYDAKNVEFSKTDGSILKIDVNIDDELKYQDYVKVMSGWAGSK